MRKKHLFQKTKIQPLEMIPTASGRHPVPARTKTKNKKPFHKMFTQHRKLKLAKS